MGDIFRFADELGPAKVIHVHEPRLGLRGILVVDNVATGPSIGGLCIAPDVSGVTARVQLRAGQTASEEELKAYCQGQIAHFKIPRYIRFVEEFPTTVTGKLQKFRMREIAAEQLVMAGHTG